MNVRGLVLQLIAKNSRGLTERQIIEGMQKQGVWNDDVVMVAIDELIASTRILEVTEWHIDGFRIKSLVATSTLKWRA